jgi:uncharacterized membrane protein YjfL (UPF0719 family)
LEPDEACVLLASVLLAAVVGIPWYAGLFGRPMTLVKGSLATRLLIGALPLALLFALDVTLSMDAAHEVRGNGQEIFLFVALGAAWLIGLAWATSWLGIHMRDDAIERNNVAAAIAASGTLTGGMIVYSCANLGEGDTIWTTIGPAVLATASILALWGLHQMVSGATDAITLDRDVAAGIRFAGMALGTGLVIGRAVAGDYISTTRTVRDLLVQGWPAAPVAALSAFIQVRLRPTKERPKPNALTLGLVPALAYVALGVVVLRCLGPWNPAGARQ